MATNEGSDNNMQFFFTLDQTPELQNTHTIFGKITGETIYNALKLGETPTDHHERPLIPHKINKVKILYNPFADISARVDRIKSSKDDKKDDKRKREGVKNFKLISFGDEAEQDEMEVVEKTVKKSELIPSSSKKEIKEEKRKRSETPPLPSKSSEKKSKKVAIEEDSDSDYELSLEKEKQNEIDRKKREIQDQIKDIKRQYQKDKKDKTKVEEEQPTSSKAENEVIQDYLDEKEKYKQQKEKTQLKGASRENFTLQLLAKFKNKLQTAAEVAESVDADSDDENWLGHKLDFSESAEAVLAKDASKKADDWYDIHDPRNPLNKRKRGADGEKKKK
jgi:peptidyl-prolyl cis-trans isomerase SDCCAG10